MTRTGAEMHLRNSRAVSPSLQVKIFPERLTRLLFSNIITLLWSVCNGTHQRC